MVVGVYLAVGMGNRCADFSPSILENENVRDIGSAGKNLGSLRPHIDHPPHTRVAEIAERGIVQWRVENDLASLIGHRRPAIGEPTRLVNLRRLESSWTKGTLGGSSDSVYRGPGLPMTDDEDRCSRERIVAKIDRVRGDFRFASTD